MAKINNDPIFLDMLKNSICKSDIGPTINPQSQLLVNEKLEICSLLLDQFNSVSPPLLPI